MKTWIKVDTEILRSFSAGYKDHSTTIGQVGEKTQHSILMVSGAMPDYDGRLQIAARPDALEIGRRSRELAGGFLDDSDSLVRVAKAFEEVDGQTVKILGDCRDVASKACFIDQGGDPNLWLAPGKVENPDGSITATSSEVFINPDGSRSTVIIVRTTHPDGMTEETKTIRTEKVINSKTAETWNQNAEDARLYFSMALSMSLGFSTNYLVINGLLTIGVVEGIAEAAGLIADGIVEIGTEVFLESIHDAEPDRGWEGGDTITNTITVETTYTADGTPVLQEVTNTTVVTDRQGEILSTNISGIDPSGTPKSGTPPITRD